MCGAIHVVCSDFRHRHQAGVAAGGGGVGAATGFFVERQDVHRAACVHDFDERAVARGQRGFERGGQRFERQHVAGVVGDGLGADADEAVGGFFEERQRVFFADVEVATGNCHRDECRQAAFEVAAVEGDVRRQVPADLVALTGRPAEGLYGVAQRGFLRLFDGSFEAVLCVVVQPALRDEGL